MTYYEVKRKKKPRKARDLKDEGNKLLTVEFQTETERKS